MSRLGLRLAFSFALIVIALITIFSWRTIHVITNSQQTALRAEANAQLAAILRVLDEESLSINARLRPLASVRELRFRAQPMAALPPLTTRGDTSSVIDSTTQAAGLPDSPGLSAGPVSGGPLDPVGLQRFVEEILPVTGLDALEVTAFSGEVLARGQYPESFGEMRDDTTTITLIAGPGVGIRNEIYREGTTATLYAVVPIKAESESAVAAILTGGIRLDRLVERLGRLTGTEVEIRTEGRVIRSDASKKHTPGGIGLLGSSGEYSWAEEAAWSVRGSELARVRVLVPATEGVLARERLVMETTAFSAVALVVAALAGIGLALGPTHRLARLTRSAVRIGTGDLETPVEVSGSDEIGILGGTLSDTVAALKIERERLAHAERIAAWRDAARRIAHELKNAITPISLALRTIQRAAEKGPEAAAVADEAVRAIADELEALRSLVDQFSQFARLPAPRLDRYDLPKALHSAATLYGADGVQIRFRGPDQVSPIQADEELMGRVWSNLISNAAHAAGREGWIEIEIVPPSRESVTVIITDSGAGLSPDRLAGTSEEGGSSKAGGWGLGLALAERIVTEHGGFLSLENAPGGGARVRVSLPAQMGED